MSPRILSVIFISLCLFRGVVSSDYNLNVPSMAPDSMARQEQFELSDFGIYTFWYKIGEFWVAQFFHATVTDTLPTLPWSLLRPNPTFNTKLKIVECSRSKVTTCMYYGNSSNGLPERVQGIFWTDGLGTTGEAFSGAGPYDRVKRVLTLDVYNRGVAVTPGNSTWNGLFWTPSGAAVLNGGLWINGGFEIHFNEHCAWGQGGNKVAHWIAQDITFGQIFVTFYLLGIKFSLPTFLADFVMTWEGQGTWHRISRIFFISAQIGDYYLRAVTDGKGKKAYWYDKGWLTYHDTVASSLFRFPTVVFYAPGNQYCMSAPDVWEPSD